MRLLSKFWLRSNAILHVKASISDLLSIVNPLDGTHWRVDPISIQDVGAALNEGDFVATSWNEIQHKIPPNLNDSYFHREIHIRRIAYLVDQGVSVDVPILGIQNTNEPNEVWFYDGNHRFAAAIVRGDTEFEVKIAASDESGVSILLPSMIAIS